MRKRKKKRRERTSRRKERKKSPQRKAKKTEKRIRELDGIICHAFEVCSDDFLENNK